RPLPASRPARPARPAPPPISPLSLHDALPIYIEPTGFRHLYEAAGPKLLETILPAENRVHCTHERTWLDAISCIAGRFGGALGELADRAAQVRHRRSCVAAAGLCCHEIGRRVRECCKAARHLDRSLVERPRDA